MSSIGVLSITSLGETTPASLADSDTVGDSRSLVMGKTVGDGSSLTSLASGISDDMSALLLNRMVGASESVMELDMSSIGVLSITSLGETTSASLADSDTVGDSRSLVMGKTVG